MAVRRGYDPRHNFKFLAPNWGLWVSASVSPMSTSKTSSSSEDRFTCGNCGSDLVSMGNWAALRLGFVDHILYTFSASTVYALEGAYFWLFALEHYTHDRLAVLGRFAHRARQQCKGRAAEVPELSEVNFPLATRKINESIYSGLILPFINQSLIILEIKTSITTTINHHPYHPDNSQNNNKMPRFITFILVFLRSGLTFFRILFR